jgi:hypothetical protein
MKFSELYKRVDFLARRYKKRFHMTNRITMKINYRKPKKNRLERQYRIHLKAIEQAKRLSKLAEILMDIIEPLSNYEKPS